MTWLRSAVSSDLNGMASIRLIGTDPVTVDVVAVQVKMPDFYVEVANELISWLERYDRIECQLFGTAYNIIPQLEGRCHYARVENEVEMPNRTRKLPPTVIIAKQPTLI